MSTLEKTLPMPNEAEVIETSQAERPFLDDTSVYRANDAELLEIVRFAAYRYKKTASSYRNVARMIANNEHRELLNSLADRKQEAADLLRDKYGVEIAVIAGNAGNAETRYILDVNFQPITVLGEAFTFALHRELAEIRLLEQVSLRQGQSRLKRFLIGQIALCKKHIRLLEDDFSRLATSYGSWI